MPGRIALIVLAVAPMLVLSATPWSANGKLFFLGMLPAGVGLLVSIRVAAAGGVLTGALMAVAVLLQGEVAAGALFMAILGAAIGLSAARGWHGVGAYAGAQTSFALIGTPMVALASGTVAAQSAPAATATMGAAVAAGGLWIAFIGWLARHQLPSGGPHTVPIVAAQYFAAALGVLVGTGTLVALRWAAQPDAWWLVLTLFVVVQPYYAATLERSTYRVLGTVLGAVAAALVGASLDGLPEIVAVVSLVVTAGAVWAYLRQPYWVYAAFLTPAVILQTSGGTDAIAFADLERVVFTLSAAGAAVVTLTVGHRIVTRR